MTEANEAEPASKDPDATTYMRPEDNADEGDSQPGDLTGRTFDDFRILRKLGSGGMASVYLADQMSLGRRVAIKLMSPSISDESMAQRSLQRFRTEAMAAAALTHPNIVQVYTVGEAEGMPYIAMEYVPGRNLSELVRRMGPLEIRLALHIIRQACRALGAAHTAGVIHRDIKPANILVSPKGDVKVADFGLSQLTSGPMASPGLTQTGTTVGTPRYMSPEQIEGRNVDARSDLYSLGVTLFYVLAGRPPFDSPSPMVLASQHLRDIPPSIADFRNDLPQDVVELVQQLLAKNPNDRCESAAEVVRELGTIIAGLDSPLEDDHSMPEISASRILSTNSKSQPAKTGTSRGAVVLTGLLALLVGLASAGLTRPRNPLRDSIQIPKAESARDQYVSAMLSGDPAEFRAVEEHWPLETRWVKESRIQRLLSALPDTRRSSEARQLIDQLSRPGSDRESQLIAYVAEVVLLTYEGKLDVAKNKYDPRRDSEIQNNLDRTWVGLWEEASETLRSDRG